MRALKGIVLVEGALVLLPLALPVLGALVIVLALVAYFLATPLYILVAAFLAFRLWRWWQGRPDRPAAASQSLTS